MTALLSGILLVPYGTDTWSADGLALGRQAFGGLELAASFPCHVVNRSSRAPLRFNNGRYDLEGMPDMTDSGGSERLYIQDLLKRQGRPWDKTGATLVERYFETIDGLIEAHAPELDEKLAPFAGLFARADWLYSAPRPLPRAHVFAPAGPVAAASLSPDDFVLVDFAFWLGESLVVLTARQSNLTPKKARERAERLQVAGIRHVAYGADDLGAEVAPRFFTEALAPVLPRFWEGDPVPAGPFRSRAFD